MIFYQYSLYCLVVRLDSNHSRRQNRDWEGGREARREGASGSRKLREEERRTKEGGKEGLR